MSADRIRFVILSTLAVLPIACGDAQAPTVTRTPTPVITATPTPDSTVSVSIPPPPPPPGPAVVGTVLMPNGLVARVQHSWSERLANVATHAALALSGNVEPVGRNVEVHLVHRRGDGSVQELGTTFTNDQGQYRSMLPSGTDEHTCGLIVSVGDTSAGTLTRAFVDSTSEPVNIDFASEAAVRLILDRVGQGTNLCCFSAAEIRALVSAVRTVPGVITGVDAAEVNASAFQAVAAIPAIQAMTDAAVGPECGDAGPVVDASRCNVDSQCSSGSCVDGYCCPASCPPGEACVLGECMAPTANGSPCAVSAQCRSFCVDSTCCESAFCPRGQVCNAPENPGRCTALLPTPTRPPRATQTITPTLGPQRHVLEVAAVDAAPGTQASIAVTLHSMGLPVAGTQNDLTFDSLNTPIAAKPNRRPDCSVNPEIAKGATSFAFRPSGCIGAACTSIRALVLATDNVDAIPDGSVLYTCIVNIAASASGRFPIVISGIILSDPNGNQIPGATGVDGSIAFGVVPPVPLPTLIRLPTRTPTASPVREPQQQVLEVSTVDAQPGTQVSLAVTLHSMGFLVAGTQNDLTFDSTNTPIAARANGRPDCTVNPDINKDATAFAFRPNGCSGASCTGVRVLVLSAETVDPIVDGSVLYTCKVNVSEGAHGVYALAIGGVIASMPDGAAVPSATGTDGAIVVGDAVSAQ